MNLDKLQRTLKREFMRNPTKSATLLALIPVAGYFIVPLLWKQIPSASAKGGNTTSQPSFVAAASNASIAAVTTGPLSLPRWQDVAEWMVRDALMKPSTVVSSRDPFRPTAKPEEVTKVDEEQPAVEIAPSAASLRPEDCGLELTATIVGPNKRLATINGRLYAESARIRFETSGEMPAEADSAFVLKSVAKKHVMLERHGELFQLRFGGSTEN